MTKKELKEMVDSTISSNGEKAITGQTLNLALNAIIESTSAKTISTPDSEEAQAHNAALYQDIKAAFEAGEKAPDIYITSTTEDGDSTASIQYLCTAIGLYKNGIVLIPSGIPVQLILKEDGTLDDAG